MDSKERQVVDRLERNVGTVIDQNRQFQTEVLSMVTALKEKVEQKHVPINLERDILSVLQQALQDSIKKTLTDYGSPLPKYVSLVMSRHEKSISDILDAALTEAFSKEEFIASVKESIAHKAARTLVSVGEGALDKSVNELKQSPAFKAKAVLMLTELAKEFIVERKTA